LYYWKTRCPLLCEYCLALCADRFWNTFAVNVGTSSRCNLDLQFKITELKYPFRASEKQGVEPTLPSARPIGPRCPHTVSIVGILNYCQTRSPKESLNPITGRHGTFWSTNLKLLLRRFMTEFTRCSLWGKLTSPESISAFKPEHTGLCPRR
jgi:hypothetical protein